MRITVDKIRQAIAILENNKPKPEKDRWVIILTKKERQVIVNNLELAIRCHKSIWHNTIAEVKDVKKILEGLGRIA